MFHEGGTGRLSARSGGAPSSAGEPPGYGSIGTSVTTNVTRTAAPQNTSTATSPFATPLITRDSCGPPRQSRSDRS